MTLDLRRPHGFLLWRGKKAAVLDPGDLPIGEPLEVRTGDEAFGVATLGSPARMLASEADRKEYFEAHRVWPREREAWWPGAKEFRLYPVERFEPYPQIRRDVALKECEGRDCLSCVHEGARWCRLHDLLAEEGKACADWEEFGDWRGPDDGGAAVKSGADTLAAPTADALDQDSESKMFDPDQPRVPPGNPEGGRWTSYEAGYASAIIQEADEHHREAGYVVGADGKIRLIKGEEGEIAIGVSDGDVMSAHAHWRYVTPSLPSPYDLQSHCQLAENIPSYQTTVVLSSHGQGRGYTRFELNGKPTGDWQTVGDEMAKEWEKIAWDIGERTMYMNSTDAEQAFQGELYKSLVTRASALGIKVMVKGTRWWK
jgi:hypothetical protein